MEAVRWASRSLERLSTGLLGETVGTRSRAFGRRCVRAQDARDARRVSWPNRERPSGVPLSEISPRAEHESRSACVHPPVRRPRHVRQLQRVVTGLRRRPLATGGRARDVQLVLVGKHGERYLTPPLRRAGAKVRMPGPRAGVSGTSSSTAFYSLATEGPFSVGEVDESGAATRAT